MSVDRPTFHEAWYRVAGLRPRLLSGVKVYRQNFRGQTWYVLENPSNNKYIRISTDAYHFTGLFDGKQTISEIWQICNEQYGDRSPTQGEVIQILAQLYSSNLLYVEIAPDTENLFNRYHTRVKREIQGFITNLLFIRIPVIDPDHFLSRWAGILGSIFSRPGLAIWVILIGAGLYFAGSNIRELIHQSSEVLAPDNLVLLYLSTVVIKIFHEFGHAFACKKFGRLNNSGGQVHVMGVMFLVFLPLPYMDASSAWAFRSKWHRMIVGMAGIIVELAVAAVAVIVWANTSAGTVHIIAYNIIFIASVSTVLFNANPLLRYDAYYVLSDLIEIPNLSQRSKDYFYYIVRKYGWGVKSVRTPAHTSGERYWLLFYGIASTAYRIFISIRILLFLNDTLPEELFILVPIFAGSAIIMWVIFPLGKFVRYLITSEELARSRIRAVGSTLASLVLTVVLIGIIPLPDYNRVEGIVEPVKLGIVHAGSGGFVVDYLPSGRAVTQDGEFLSKAVNIELEAEREGLIAELRGVRIQRHMAEAQEMAAAQILDEQIAVMEEKIGRINADLSSLNMKPAFSGTWVSPNIERLKGVYLHRGEQVGLVADLDEVLIRAIAGQDIIAMFLEKAYRDVEIRVKGRPDVMLTGKIEKIFPAGHEILPSEALGYAVGGSTPTVSQDPHGTRAAERFFEIRIRPDQVSSVRLLTGQRVVVRIRMSSKPLASQWWQSLRQLFQRRFHI